MRIDKARSTAAVMICAIGLHGCETQYKPARSPRVSVVMQGGNIAYEKNGEVRSFGFLGSGLVETVEDDPEAREAAESFRSRSTTGLVLIAVGGACLIGGMVLAFKDIDRSANERSSGRNAAEVGLGACALGGFIGGTIEVASAQPYQYDAINIYNDHVERRMRMGPPPPPAWAVPVPMPAPRATVPPAPPAPPPAPSTAPADAGVRE